MIESFLESIGLSKEISKHTSQNFAHIITPDTAMHEHFDQQTKSKSRACFHFPIGTTDIPSEKVTEVVSFRYLNDEILYKLPFSHLTAQAYLSGEKSRGCLDNRFVHNPDYSHFGTIMSLVVKLVIISHTFHYFTYMLLFL